MKTIWKTETKFSPKLKREIERKILSYAHERPIFISVTKHEEWLIGFKSQKAARRTAAAYPTETTYVDFVSNPGRFYGARWTAWVDMASGRNHRKSNHGIKTKRYR